ncbi:MAG TPA: alpha-ketoglutarate-dependent dioxygenase AlkB [Rhodospirillaceae bacterium]|nr:alpha-ketoglutarate-dependent dioxygenase AlkB [Rhodospirillaceae bacterium]|tara:strand:+ start:168 stop:770 length:603 start_codon:yes stop_codon:yes gene_type:complete
MTALPLGLPPVPLAEADTMLYPQHLADAEDLFRRLHDDLPWRQEHLTLFGKRIAQPRLSLYQGDVPYTYSGLTLAAAAWHPVLADLRDRCAELAGMPFNTVLANLYRDGSDSMDWHADDEAELGAEPVIASVSLGAPRRFQMRRKDKTGEAHCLTLGGGDVLIMGPKSQVHWMHRVPKTKTTVGPRINLTFRFVREPQRR